MDHPAYFYSRKRQRHSYASLLRMLTVYLIEFGNGKWLTNKQLLCVRCSRNTAARMVAFPKLIKSGSKAGSQFSLSYLALSTGVNWTSAPGVYVDSAFLLPLQLNSLL